MTAPARKSAAKKAPARKSTSAAVAARREVRGEKNKPVIIDVPFRGETFKIPLDRIGNGKVFLRQKAVEHFAGPDQICALLFDVLGPADSARWIALMEPGDEIFGQAGQFFSAMNKATNVPN